MNETTWLKTTDRYLMLDYLLMRGIINEAAQTAYNIWGIHSPLGEEEKCELLRCAFHNPFNPIHVDCGPYGPMQPHKCDVFDSNWRTDNIVGLAKRIRDDYIPGLYEFLHDALIEARCDIERLLKHCLGYEVCYNCLGVGRCFDLIDRETHLSETWVTCQICEGKKYLKNTNMHCRSCYVLQLILGDT
jgi:hypothetical protein